MSFSVFIFYAVFLVQVFSFLRTVCGYRGHLDVFIIVSFVKSTRKAIFAEAKLRCGDFLLEKKMSSHYWQFFFLFGLDYQTLFEFSQI